jgi:Domain of unknown function (DUF4326)
MGSSKMQFTNSSNASVGKVLNSQHIPYNILPANSVYVDKGSRWANPFTVGVDGTNHEVCDLYDQKLANDPKLLQSIDVLVGKDLLCGCGYDRCHAHTLTRLATMPLEQRMIWAEQVKNLSQALAA